MGAKRKVAILLHEKDRYPKDAGHFLWWLCDVWRASGIEVEIVRGIGRPVDADVLISHVDVTVMPEAYRKFFEQYPRVVNRNVRDISKRLISRNLIGISDSYDGPVIVKTNRNCGGLTDLEFPGRKVSLSLDKKESFWSTLLKRSRKSADWAKVNCIRAGDYQVFSSAREVPEAVFQNEALVVERFLPERDEEGAYCLRYYIFLGDQGFSSLVRARTPVVKHESIFRREIVAIPEEMLAIRRELKLDYGKLDFVMRDGRAVLLDANATPGNLATIPEREGYAARVAPGLASFF